MLEINCLKCENFIDPVNGCKQYGQEPIRAAQACVDDHFKNYTVKPEFQKEFVPGLEVWAVERDEDGTAVGVAGLVFLAEVAGAVIATPYIYELDDVESILEYHIQETAVNGGTDLMVFPEADCYCSREEAKQAFRKEQEE